MFYFAFQIDELEKKLKEQKQDSDSILLHHKVKISLITKNHKTVKKKKKKLFD